MLSVGVRGERRGVDRSSPAISFSTPEQALLGSCTSEDCVLGPAQGSSYFQSHVEQVVPVSRSPVNQNGRDTMASRDKEIPKEGGFGPTPAFTRPQKEN